MRLDLGEAMRSLGDLVMMSMRAVLVDCLLEVESVAVRMVVMSLKHAGLVLGSQIVTAIVKKVCLIAGYEEVVQNFALGLWH